MTATGSRKTQNRRRTDRRALSNPLNKQPAVADGSVDLPVGDAVAQRVMSLPMHPYLGEADSEKVVSALRDMWV